MMHYESRKVMSAGEEGKETRVFSNSFQTERENNKNIIWGGKHVITY